MIYIISRESSTLLQHFLGT